MSDNTVAVDNIINKTVREYYKTDEVRKLILRDFWAAQEGVTAPFRELTPDQAEVLVRCAYTDLKVNI